MAAMLACDVMIMTVGPGMLAILTYVDMQIVTSELPI